MIEQVSFDDLFKKMDDNIPINIIGIDTGLANVGWAVIQVKRNGPSLIDSGVITTSTEYDLSERIYMIGKSIKEIIHNYHVELMAYEELYYNQKRPHMMKTNLPVGAIMYIGWEEGLRPKKFRPQDAKKYVANKNTASKEEVAYSVALHLGLHPKVLEQKKDHETDAIAHALCYYGYLKQEWLKSKDTEKKRRRRKRGDKN